MTEQTESRVAGRPTLYSAEKLAELAEALNGPLGGIGDTVARLGEGAPGADQRALVARLTDASAALRSAAGALSQGQATAAAPEGAALLVLEPDAGHGKLLTTVLGHLGHSVVRVGTLEAALDLLARRRFGAVFAATDADAGGFWRLCLAVRGAASLPLVGMARRMTPAAHKEALDCGADWVVEAPATVHDLRQALVAAGVRDPMLRQVRAA